MKKDILGAGLLWIVLSIGGMVAAAVLDFYPEARSDKAEEIEQAFRVLLIMSAPVCALVIAVLVWVFLRSSSFRMPEEDGMNLQGRGPVPAVWLIATTALAAVTMAYGVIEIPKVMGHESNPDLEVNVEGIQWTWLVNYPASNATAREIVLPIDRTVTFNVTSRDVLHSFWIPAFYMKIDAVPGLTTEVSLKPISLGSYQTDPNLRLQCTELCGTSHANMRIPVRVVTQAEFDEWLAGQAKPEPTPGGTPSGDVTAFTIIAKNITFDIGEMKVKAGSTVQLTIDNQDGGIMHNWALYTSEDAANANEAPLANTELEAGPIQQQLTFTAPAAGEYFYRCDVHPTTMTGKLIAE